MASLETSKLETEQLLAHAAGSRAGRDPAAGVAAPSPLVGVLALQGGFEAHARILEALGATRA